MEEKKKIVYKNVSELVPYENNPRNNDDAVDYALKMFLVSLLMILHRNR